MQSLRWHSGSKLSMIDAIHIEVHRDGANPSSGQHNQAMGPTKGGLNPELHGPHRWLRPTTKSSSSPPGRRRM